MAGRWLSRLAALDRELAGRTRSVPLAQLASVLDDLVGALDDTERLIELSAEWGRHPAVVGLATRHYVLLGDTLRESLRELLGHRWDAELQAAWLEAAILVTSVMKRSALRASGEWPRPAAPAERE